MCEFVSYDIPENLMGTPCITTMRDQDGDVIFTLYRHNDGNPLVHGRFLVDLLLQHTRGVLPNDDRLWHMGDTHDYFAAHVVAALVDEFRRTPMTWGAASDAGVTKAEWWAAPVWDAARKPEMRIVRCSWADTISAGLVVPGTDTGHRWEYQLHGQPGGGILASVRQLWSEHDDLDDSPSGAWLDLRSQVESAEHQMRNVTS